MSIASRRMIRGGRVAQGTQQSPYNYGFTVGSDLNSTSSATRRSYFTDMVSMGASWVRIDASWETIQAGGPTSWDYTGLDAIVADAHYAGLKILLIPAYSPSWAGPATNGPSAPYDVNTYATFVNNLVGRYYPTVSAYEIWNEPNNASFWQDTVANPYPNPAHYIQLLRAAYPAAKAAAPGCTVITGGTAPEPETPLSSAYMSPRQWLTYLYTNPADPSHTAKGYFDAIGHHPYAYPAVPSQYYEWSAWSQMNETSPSLRSIMIANGDTDKKIWMTETGEPTDGNASTNQLLGEGYSVAQCEQIQATNNTEAVQYNSTYSWAGPVFLWTYIDRYAYGASTDVEGYWGAYRSDGSAKPAVAALRSL